jgi:hypothetical protein
MAAAFLEISPTGGLGLHPVPPCNPLVAQLDDSDTIRLVFFRHAAKVPYFSRGIHRRDPVNILPVLSY